MPRPMFLALAILLALATLATKFAAAQDRGGATPPPAVVVAEIEIGPVEAPETFTARVEAIQSVDLRARVQGYIEKVHFAAGARVLEGDLLFEIEPDLYEAQLTSAQAQLAQADAERERTEREFARQRELVSRQAVSQAAADQAEADFLVAQANVEAARAAVRRAELDVDYTRIEAPIAGQIGRALISQGNYVGPDSGPLARIVQLDPLRVVFSISEQLLISIRQDTGSAETPTPGDFDFRLRLADGSLYGQSGRFEFIASEVDPRTGTVPVRLIYGNPDNLLVPGQFVTVEVAEKDIPERPIVPQTAILQDREGRYVYLLGEDGKVARRSIETGARLGDGWAVENGLEGGETVVVQGVQRLADGVAVEPTPAAATGGEAR